MNNCNWEPIHGFETPGELRRLRTWLDSQQDAGLIEEIPIDQKKNKFPFRENEKWFRCKESGEVWSLVAPEAPSRGWWDIAELER